MTADGIFAGMDDLDSAPVKEASADNPPKRKKASKSPTKRSLDHMRKLGYTCAIVEHWNAFVRQRKDLFGFIDVLCLKDGETVAVQTTSASNMSDRVKKIADHENVAAVRAAGWKILVQGWRKNAAGKYVLREVDVS
jgi:hypothetical protein